MNKAFIWSGSADYFDNVMTKFIVNNRTEAWETGFNLFFFFFRSITKCLIVHSRSLTHRVNYMRCGKFNSMNYAMFLQFQCHNGKLANHMARFISNCGKIFYYLASSVSSEMNQILRCDWLPERERWSYLAHSGLHAVSRENSSWKKHCVTHWRE